MPLLNYDDDFEVDAFSDTYIASRLLATYIYTACLPRWKLHINTSIWNDKPTHPCGTANVQLQSHKGTVMYIHNQLFFLACRDVKGSPESQKS